MKLIALDVARRKYAELRTEEVSVKSWTEGADDMFESILRTDDGEFRVNTLDIGLQ